MVIFLNGASSSGKTTLARALQAAWSGPTGSGPAGSGPLVYLSLDSVISQLPFQYTGNGDQSALGFPLIRDDHQGSTQATVGIGDHGLRLNQLAANHARSVAEAGYDLVIDYVFLQPTMLAPFSQALSAVEVCFIGVYCDPGELERRSAGRADRATHLGQMQQESIHFCSDNYDLELDSTTESAEELARKVRTFLEQSRILAGMG